jgi:hypothetical protein
LILLSLSPERIRVEIFRTLRPLITDAASVLTLSEMIKEALTSLFISKKRSASGLFGLPAGQFPRKYIFPLSSIPLTPMPLSSHTLVKTGNTSGLLKDSKEVRMDLAIG